MARSLAGRRGVSDPLTLLRDRDLPAEGAARRLSGGDMGEVFRVGDLVVKTLYPAPEGLFSAESRGLSQLAACGVRVPDVVHADEQCIVMEALNPGRDCSEEMGRMVARLHRQSAELCDLDPLFIGRFRLPAGTGAGWADHWWTHRIRPLVAVTSRDLGPLAGEVERVSREVVWPDEPTCWIHGDLWSGNVMHSADGPALIDPSAQVAQRVVDLAMIDLFGGFSQEFHRGYDAIYPVTDAVRACIPVAQLYFALVHAHFFGRSYIPMVNRLVRLASR